MCRLKEKEPMPKCLKLFCEKNKLELDSIYQAVRYPVDNKFNFSGGIGKYIMPPKELAEVLAEGQFLEFK